MPEVLARALEAAGHDVYLPQRDTPAVEGTGRTTGIFQLNLTALTKAEAVVAVCDGPQVDDGTAWEIGSPTGGTFRSTGSLPMSGSGRSRTSGST